MRSVEEVVIPLRVELGSITDNAPTELISISETASFEINQHLLQKLEVRHPDLHSHTIAVVGATGVGKSSVIRGLTPYSCPKPAVANNIQAQHGNSFMQCSAINVRQPRNPETSTHMIPILRFWSMEIKGITACTVYIT